MGHPKAGGRTKGTPNKSTREIQELAEKLECNPFEILLHFAKGDFEALGYEEHQTKAIAGGGMTEELTISPELRAQSAERACQYLYPKRKAIEMEIQIEEPTFSDEELEARIKLLTNQIGES